jgi:Icc protein
MALLIAQISDFHVTPPGTLAYGCVDTGAALAAAVAAINTLPRLPDLVIGTGDLTQSGSEEEYSALQAILAELKPAFLPVLGNHDRRSGLRRAFPEIDRAIGDQKTIQYVHDLEDQRIIVLDTVQEGGDDPDYPTDRAAWLRQALRTDQRVLIAMHHPPFPCGVAWLEPTNADWSDPIGDAVETSSQVDRVICGHVHRGLHRLWRGVFASAAPSTAHQVYFDLNADAPPALALEAPGFQIHDWSPGAVTTYSLAINGLSNRFIPRSSGVDQ